MPRIVVFGGVLGAIVFGWGAAATLLVDLWALVALFEVPVLSLAVTSMAPDEFGSWMTLFNTGLLTLGTTLIVLRQRWIRSDYEVRTQDLHQKIDQNQAADVNRQERLCLERQALQAQLREIQGRLDATFRFLALYREALKVDRDWMQDVARRHNEPLPEGFGRRAFDAIPEEQWASFLISLNPPLRPDIDVTTATPDILRQYIGPPVRPVPKVPQTNSRYERTPPPLPADPQVPEVRP